jgi:hypothetical protein
MTKNCNVNLKVRFPPGFSLTVAKTDVRGFALLDDTCQATIGGRFWWSGQSNQVSIFTSTRLGLSVFLQRPLQFLFT